MIRRRLLPVGVNPGVSIVFEPLIVASSIDRRKLAAIGAQLDGLEGDVIWEIAGEGGATYVFRLGPGTVRILHGTSPRALGRIATSVSAFFALLTRAATPAELLGLGELTVRGPIDGSRLASGFVDYLDGLRSAGGSESRVTQAWLDFALRSARTGHSFRPPARAGHE